MSHDDRNDGALVDAARDVARNAYSPYSAVRVGAALRAEDGSVHVGCNVENASFGLTICAERTALVAAIASGARAFTDVAIWSDRAALLMPCGACRQMLSELAPELRVLVAGDGLETREYRLAELLPGAVGPDDLRAR